MLFSTPSGKEDFKRSMEWSSAGEIRECATQHSKEKTPVIECEYVGEAVNEDGKSVPVLQVKPGSVPLLTL